MFGRKNSQPWFFESSVYIEAISRLLYLVENQASLALVHGADGSGRTQLLQHLQRELRRMQISSCLVNVSGLDSDSLLQNVAGSLAIPISPAANRTELLFRLRDELLGRSHCGVRTVLMLDDIHRAYSDQLPAIQYLAALNSLSAGQVTVVLTSNTSRISGLQSATTLQVALPMLSPEESVEFVADFLNCQASPDALLPPTAIRAIAELSGRLPAQLVQVCSLLSVVRETSPELPIDERVVRDIIREINPRAVA
jgi:type II secretory pathway predicted ATPase ExeA